MKRALLVAVLLWAGHGMALAQTADAFTSVNPSVPRSTPKVTTFEPCRGPQCPPTGPTAPQPPVSGVSPLVACNIENNPNLSAAQRTACVGAGMVPEKTRQWVQAGIDSVNDILTSFGRPRMNVTPEQVATMALGPASGTPVAPSEQPPNQPDPECQKELIKTAADMASEAAKFVGEQKANFRALALSGALKTYVRIEDWKELIDQGRWAIPSGLVEYFSARTFMANACRVDPSYHRDCAKSEQERQALAEAETGRLNAAIGMYNQQMVSMRERYARCW